MPCTHVPALQHCILTDTARGKRLGDMLGRPAMTPYCTTQIHHQGQLTMCAKIPYACICNMHLLELLATDNLTCKVALCSAELIASAARLPGCAPHVIFSTRDDVGYPSPHHTFHAMYHCITWNCCNCCHTQQQQCPGQLGPHHLVDKFST